MSGKGRVLVAVFLLGMGTRLAMLPLSAAGEPWPDERTYRAVAANLLEGRGYSAHPEMPKESFVAPGYPTFLAALRNNPVLVYLAQALLGGLGAAALAGAGLMLYGGAGALVAGAAFALYPPFVYYSGRFLVEALYLPLLCFLVFLAALVRWRGSRGSEELWLWAGAGFASAAAVLTRPGLLPHALLLFLAAAWGRRRGALGLAVLAFCLASGMVPWMARNAMLHGEFIPFTTGVGWALYEGNNPVATGGVKSGPWPIEDEIAGLPEAKADELLARGARRFIAENPGRFARLALVKEKRTWDAVPHAPGFSSGPRAVVAAAAYLALAAAGATGLLLGLRRRRSVAFGLVPVVITVLAHLVYVGSVRYRAPAEVGFALLAGCAASLVWRRR